MANEIVAFNLDNVEVRQDLDGRFCLNDLHKAAGGDPSKQLSNWTRLDQTAELIAELQKEITHIRVIDSKQGVGTFVVKELVYAYAMWISPAFHLKVIRTFDSIMNGPQTAGDALVQMAMAYRAHERRIMALEVEQAETRQAIVELVGGDDYATAKGYARTNNLPATRDFLTRVGKRASAMCRERGIRIGRVMDEVWGEVNSYPRQILAAAFDELQ